MAFWVNLIMEIRVKSFEFIRSKALSARFGPQSSQSDNRENSSDFPIFPSESFSSLIWIHARIDKLNDASERQWETNSRLLTSYNNREKQGNAEMAGFSLRKKI